MLEWSWRFFTEIKLTDFLIAAFTGLLWWSTNKLWRETKRLAEGADDQSKKMEASIKATRDVAAATGLLAEAADEQASAMRKAAGAAEASARAAQKSADAAMGVEVARLILTKIKSNNGGIDLKVWLRRADLEAHIENHGRTVAVITETCLAWYVDETFPDGLPYPQAAITKNLHSFVALPGKPFRFERHLSLSEEQTEAIIAGRAGMLVYGYVKFLDFLNNEWIVGFSRILEVSAPKRFPTLTATRGTFVNGGPRSYTFMGLTQQRHD